MTDPWITTLLSGHDVLALEAVHCHGDSCHWIDLTLKGAGDQEMMWSLFFRGPHAEAAVRIYVDAINEATRKIGELQLPIEVPAIVAEGRGYLHLHGCFP